MSTSPDQLVRDSELHDGFVPERIIGRQHPLRWVAAACVLVLVAMLIRALLTQPAFEWRVVGQYLFNRRILTGLEVTIFLTITTMVTGVVLGVVLAIMQGSSNPILSISSKWYIWFFRGTPALVQLIFWFNLAALIPRLSLGIPFGPAFVSASANQFITPLVAANLGLGLNEAAYMSEIVRGGISSVDAGQVEAASALGMSRSTAMRKIILPQAMRMIIPPTGNQVIGMLKYTSLASVISLTELLESTQLVYQRTFQTIPLLIVASIWYLVLTTLLTIGQRFLERRYGRGVPGKPQSSRMSWRSIMGGLVRSRRNGAVA